LNRFIDGFLDYFPGLLEMIVLGLGFEGLNVLLVVIDDRLLEMMFEVLGRKVQFFERIILLKVIS
jgi:hypothetical protein